MSHLSRNLEILADKTYWKAGQEFQELVAHRGDSEQEKHLLKERLLNILKDSHSIYG